MPSFWSYTECPLTGPMAAVVKHLPPGVSLAVYKVRSGDSGESYYVQCLRREYSYETGMSSHKTVEHTYLCSCEAATIRGGNIASVANYIPGCKHSTRLVEYLNERRKS